MNRFFSTESTESEYPQTAYARVDQFEPIYFDEAEEVTIAFDAMDASWRGFREGGPLDLNRAEQEVKRYWTQLFEGGGEIADNPIVSGLDEVPLYRIEITVPTSHEYVSLLRDGAQWVQIELAPRGEIEAFVFAGAFANPVQAWIESLTPKGVPATALDRIFDMSLWPKATEAQISAELPRGCPIEQLLMLDIGQGSANALTCKCGLPRLCFDVGCGVYGNKKTCPPGIQFCTCDKPLVILSHWDADHWTAATLDTDLLKLTWIVPCQTISQSHATFAASILAAGGKLLIFPPYGTVTWGAPQLEIRQCKGALNNKNESGLVLIVTNKELDRTWLLMGDAPYNLIPGDLPENISVIVAPHHGAKMSPNSVPPARPAHDYARLLYSFGPGNTHGRTKVQHPTIESVIVHQSEGWKHGSWVPPMLPSDPGSTVAGLDGDVLATAVHLVDHIGGARVGWLGMPSAPIHLLTCGKTMSIPQT
ncbi:hypothetical protein [Stenotrophomonas maltophilia]|uniref:hypothetical protein n=1 Tax=Stenotrophomonas maltophilia TaxID=40324 RepID=UPI0007F90D23|nr:hypothetical protein [Stenotrophomonas maltophilia]OBU58942.1 hypothetical protein A9K70_00020 [Stenotrophomonas maltophilia]